MHDHKKVLPHNLIYRFSIHLFPLITTLLKWAGHDTSIFSFKWPPAFLFKISAGYLCNAVYFSYRVSIHVLFIASSIRY